LTEVVSNALVTALITYSIVIRAGKQRRERTCIAGRVFWLTFTLAPSLRVTWYDTVDYLPCMRSKADEMANLARGTEMKN